MRNILLASTVCLPIAALAQDADYYTVTPQGGTSSSTLLNLTGRQMALEDFSAACGSVPPAGDGVEDETCWLTAAENAFAAAPTLMHTATIHLYTNKAYYFADPPQLPDGLSIDGGNIKVAAVPTNYSYLPNSRAGQYIRFGSNPNNGDTITLNGTVVTFVTTGGGTGTDVPIGANLQATMAAAATVLNASSDTQISKNTYYSTYVTAAQNFNKYAFGTIEMVSKVGGVSSNSYTVAASNATYLPATHLTGGGLPFLGGSIVLGANPLLPGNGTSIKNAYIIHVGMISPPNGPAVAQTSIAGFADTAISNSGTTAASDFSVTDSLIVGFNTAVFSMNGSRIKIDNLMFDATNGVNLNGMYDVSYIGNSIANDFYLGGASANGVTQGIDTTYRLGVAFAVQGGSSGTRMENDFSYGHAVKFLVGNEFDISCEMCAADGPLIPSQSEFMVKPVVLMTGSGYSSKPTITMSCGGTLMPTISNGAIVALTNVAPTSCGSNTPMITITDSTGTGATATTTLVTDIGIESYGTVDRLYFNGYKNEIQSLAGEIGSIGQTVIASPLIGSDYVNDFEVTAGNFSVIGGYIGSNPSGSNIVFQQYAGYGNVSFINFNSDTGAAPITTYSSAPLTCTGNIFHSGGVPDTCGNIVPYDNGSSLSWTDQYGAHPRFVVQSDNNFVFYGTSSEGANAKGGTAIFACPMRNGSPTCTWNYPLQIRSIASQPSSSSVLNCGTGATVSGNYMKGDVAPGAGATSCQIVFLNNTAYNYVSEPTCTVSPSKTASSGVGATGAVGLYVDHTTSTAGTINVGFTTAGGFSYLCTG